MTTKVPKPEDIRLYPMTQDVYGERTHEQYVDSMAAAIIAAVCDYRLEYKEFRKLLDYAEWHHDRLNTYERRERSILG